MPVGPLRRALIQYIPAPCRQVYGAPCCLSIRTIKLACQLWRQECGGFPDTVSGEKPTGPATRGAGQIRVVGEGCGLGGSGAAAGEVEGEDLDPSHGPRETCPAAGDGSLQTKLSRIVCLVPILCGAIQRFVDIPADVSIRPGHPPHIRDYGYMANIASCTGRSGGRRTAPSPCASGATRLRK